MIIPSIDIMDGQAVQLTQGRTKVLEAGDPRPLAERFGRIGEIAVVDLDAALGTGSNAPLIRELLPLARCRVGGGIRSAEAALGWLDAGAAKVVLGTAAIPEVLEAIPKSRVIAALDAWEGEVVVKGWTEGTGRSISERMAELGELVDGFLVTFVEGEGLENGFPQDVVTSLVGQAGRVRLTVAGGITTPGEIGWLDRCGADAQVGMALYKGTLGLAEAVCAPLKADREDGLWPTVVADEAGRVLGLVWSNLESLSAALAEGRGIYHSRSRGLWRKGDTSGSSQELLGVALDCDRDSLLFRVRQQGSGFCHEGTWTCFGHSRGFGALEQTIRTRQMEVATGSLTARLLNEPEFLSGKFLEEAQEVVDAIDADHLVREAADVAYFLSVMLARAGRSLSDVETELDRRRLKVTRRPPSPAGGEG